jgi:misacylated tRNA(Ala) deacylase
VTVPTVRLYLQDDHCFEHDASIVALRADAFALDRSCFYPGGGGQPPDDGSLKLDSGETFEIVSVRSDENDVVWHASNPPPPLGCVGKTARVTVNRDKRVAFSRYHTVLHVLNTIALRDYDGWITGAQIAVEYSRIDFKLDGFSAALCAELEQKVNAVLAQNHTLRAYYLPEQEFRQRQDLLRTLDVKPPVRDGHVRVVEIQGFDAQACGGTHVEKISEVGRFSIVRTENKGKNNKRLYVKLDVPIEC